MGSFIKEIRRIGRQVRKEAKRFGDKLEREVKRAVGIKSVGKRHTVSATKDDIRSGVLAVTNDQPRFLSPAEVRRSQQQCNGNHTWSEMEQCVEVTLHCSDGDESKVELYDGFCTVCGVYRVQLGSPRSSPTRLVTHSNRLVRSFMV
jgi:hypothetical protein